MRKLAMFAWSFAAAAAIYIWLLPTKLAIWAALLLLLLALASLFVCTDRMKRMRIIALGLAVGVLWSRYYERQNLEPLRSFCGDSVQITAEVSREPQKSQYGTCVQVRFCGSQMMLYLDCEPDELAFGDEVCLTAEVVDVSRGSGDENNLYYQSNDISLLGFQRGELSVEKAANVPIRYYPQLAAISVRERIEALFPADTAGFVRALLVGDRDGMRYQTENDMSITGISHVVSVSGMHVTLIVAVIQLLCLRRRRLAAGISFAVMFLFAAMLGFSPSVTRAVIMNSVFLLAPLVGRENDSLTSLGAALLVILLHNPWAIANVSLQLSFAAMVGIFLITPRLYGRLIRFAGDRQWNKKYPLCYKAYRSAAVTFATSLGANIVTVPLVAMTFGTVSLVSPLTNFLLLPIISFVFTASFVMLVVVFTCSPLPFFSVPAVFLADKFAWLLSWMIRGVLWMIDKLASLPYAAVYTCSDYIVAWLVFAYAVGIGYWFFRRKYKPFVPIGCVAVSLLGACVLSALPRGTTSMTVFDVGQGQCIFLRSGDFTALVDCGGDAGDDNGEEVARRLLMAGEQHADVLILTHYDIDHTCGFEQLLDRIEIGTLILPEVADDSGNKERILALAQETQTPYYFVQEDTTLQFAEGTLSLLVPGNPSEDNASLSALMSAEECDILITGDLNAEQELALLRTHELPDLEVLVAGHHGSKYSTCAELLEATTPDAVLISVGKNSYGHPTPEVLERITAVGAAVYRTDQNGEITVLR